VDNKTKKHKVTSECYLDRHYKVDHSNVDQRQKEKLAVVGGFFENKPICSFCVGKLAYLADAYPDDGITNNSTPGTYVKDSKYVNVSVFYGKKELIKRFHFEEALEGKLISDLKSALKYKISELDPQPTPIQPNIDMIRQQIKYQELEALDGGYE
jgi:hypothetical protein